MGSLPDGTKMSKICLFVLTWSINVTDRQTDRQTDIAWRHRPRLCIASRGNYDRKWSAIPIWIAGLIQIWIRISKWQFFGNLYQLWGQPKVLIKYDKDICADQRSRRYLVGPHLTNVLRSCNTSDIYLSICVVTCCLQSG